MEVNIDKKNNGSFELEIQLNTEDFQKYWEEVFDHALSHITIKGFREGQAPREVATPQVDREKVFQEAAERAVRGSLKGVIEEKGWNLITTPEVKLLPEKEGLKYKAKVVPFPEVKLRDYEKVAKESNQKLKTELDNIKIEEEEIKKAEEWLINSRWPKENKKEMTDRMAQELGHFKTVAELRESIKEGIGVEKKIREQDRNRARILDELIKQTEIPVPTLLVEKMADNLKNDLERSLAGGSISYEEYVKKHYETEEKLKESLEKQAKKEITAHLMLDELFKRIGLDVDEKEIEEEMNRFLAQQTPEAKSKVNLHHLREYSYGKIKNEKVFRKLEDL